MSSPDAPELKGGHPPAGIFPASQ